MQVYILLLFCQIADFGLSRKLDDDTVYYVTSGGMVPVNWTAPEVYTYICKHCYIARPYTCTEISTCVYK